MPTSNAVAKPTATSMIQQYAGDFAAVLPSHIKPEQWVRLTQGVFRRDANLARILERNPGTVLAALLDAARLGLDVGDTYHLIPFKDEVVGVSDYTGLIELMYRAGAVGSVKAELVRENDEFTFDPSMDKPHHKPDWFGDRGAIVGAYSYADMKDGSTSKVVVRSRAEIDQVKEVSRGSGNKDSPWQKWYDRMALKTVVRELAKFVPTSPEFIREALRAAASAHAVQQASGPPPVDAEGPIEGVDLDTGEIHDAEVVDEAADPS